MIVVDNKFEIGEKAFTTYRIPVEYKCPICEGKGSFVHNGYEVHCKNCNGSGKIKNMQVTVLDVTEVTIASIRVTCNRNDIHVKYKVNSDKNVRNRSEKGLFKTLMEAEEYCKQVNTKEISGEF